MSFVHSLTHIPPILSPIHRTVSITSISIPSDLDDEEPLVSGDRKRSNYGGVRTEESVEESGKIRLDSWISKRIDGISRARVQSSIRLGLVSVNHRVIVKQNLIRRRISILANAYDQRAKPLNGKHKSHVHSHDEAKILASYKPSINTTLLIPELKQADNMVKQALEYFNSTRHIILYYEDVIKNHTILNDVQDFLRIPLKRWHVKIHNCPLNEQVENLDDIKNVLNGTPYESFLNEDYKVS